jgi:hypothetical protein
MKSLEPIILLVSRQADGSRCRCVAQSGPPRTKEGGEIAETRYKGVMTPFGRVPCGVLRAIGLDTEGQKR